MSRIAIVLIAAVLWVASSDANAQGPCASGLGCYGFQGVPGYGVNILPYSLGRVPVPPYFALHPPVYYSRPVPRTYGYSPYAYPGTVRTPDLEIAESAMIQNPFVKPKNIEEEDETENQTAAVKVILNPYATRQLAAN